MTERDEFEMWAKGRFSLDWNHYGQAKPGEYVAERTREAWSAWSAALTAREPATEPEQEGVCELSKQLHKQDCNCVNFVPYPPLNTAKLALNIAMKVFHTFDEPLHADDIPLASKIIQEEINRALALHDVPQGPDATAWLIERGQLCLGFCGYKFSWVTFTDENALRFARKQDAYGFKESCKWTPFNLPLEDTKISEHCWIEAAPVSSEKEK